jgi:hypothetical protein
LLARFFVDFTQEKHATLFARKFIDATFKDIPKFFAFKLTAWVGTKNPRIVFRFSTFSKR